MVTEAGAIPVRVYQTPDRIMVAAPMPGLEPDDISVLIAGRRVTLRSRERGRHQHERDLLFAEWALGPYYREIDLPEPVDGARANATYDNGVLVLAMPKLAAGAAERVEISLETIRATRGERVGHMGRRIVSTTTAEHQEGKHGREPRTAETAPTPSASVETEPPRTVSGYAHVNLWRLGDGDDPSKTSAANAVGERLSEQPGFRSYTVVRTGEHEIVAITVFDSESQLAAAVSAAADVVRGRVRPLAIARPERRAGPILHHHAVA